MLKKYFPYIFLFFIIASISYVEANKPKPVDWTPSFSNSDKIPYGTYVLFDRINDLFPNEKIELVKTPIYNQINKRAERRSENESKDGSYVFINDVFSISELDANLLFEYVEEGNNVFISAMDFDLTSIGDTFKLRTEQRYFITEANQDDPNDPLESEPGNNFVHPDLATPFGYPSRGRYVDTYFSSYDSTAALVLGVDKSDKANFIKMPYGKGDFYFTSSPYVFTNYNMLHVSGMEYASKVISHLEPGPVYWDEYYKSGRKETTTSLRYFLSHEALKWMTYLIVLGSLIFVIFEGKRKQRVIPILESKDNSSIEFVEAISDLYLSKNNHRDLAEKKIKYFYEYLRTNLNIREIKHGKELINQISSKTGIAEKEVDRLLLIIRNINEKPTIFDTELILLNRRIDEFYQEAETITK